MCACVRAFVFDQQDESAAKKKKKSSKVSEELCCCCRHVIAIHNNNVHLSCAHQRPERSHDTYDMLYTFRA